MLPSLQKAANAASTKLRGNKSNTEEVEEVETVEQDEEGGEEEEGERGEEAPTSFAKKMTKRKLEKKLKQKTPLYPTMIPGPGHKNIVFAGANPMFGVDGEVAD